MIAPLFPHLRPVEGRSGSKGEDLFALSAREGTYVAAFNFDAETEMVKHASFARMGIDSSKGIVVRDLWSGQEWRIDPADDEHRIDLAPAESKLLLFKHA